MKHQINFKNIAWPKRYIKPYRAGPGLIFPTRVIALFIAIQTVLGFLIGMMAIGYLKIARLYIKKMSLKNAKFESVEIDDLKVKRLQVDQRV